MILRKGWGRLLGGLLVALAVTTSGAASVAAEDLAQPAGQSTTAQNVESGTAPPPAPIPAPDSAPQARYQTASPTGHEVAMQFQAFYERSGGLPTFGYAITAPVLENNRMVQYFERQRFERHQENAGTPYDVLLGRLGSIEAERLGLLDSASFQPLPASTKSDANCTFFPETGHRVCRDFKGYWERYGLEFGDRNISFRESLALFGYPISEQYTDAESGLTVQYFERARFEYHPEFAGTKHEVLLGLVGHPVWSEAEPTAVPAPVEVTPGQQIAAEAMKHLGKPYIWGGTGPNGFDCSGFVYYVVNQVLGGGFPRGMEGQAGFGIPVDPSSLQPGDLVFQQNTYQWGLSHAGIYIGNGQFINAANESTGVIISDLWDSYWGPRFYTARRVTG